MMRRSLFITFEGGEGVGKTTLIESIGKALVEKGLPLFTTKEPGGSLLGESIRDLLLHQGKTISNRAELLLFLADRAEHVEKVIVPVLEMGTIVLCDRYTDSTLAYQGEAREGSLEIIKKLCAFAAFDLEPTLTFYLDLDPKEGLKRVRSRNALDRMEEEDITFHEKIRKGFLELAAKETKRIYILDASESPEKVYEKAMARLEKEILRWHDQD